MKNLKSRRSFLKQSGVLCSGMIGLPQTRPSVVSEKIKHEFWSEVRSKFPLQESRVYFNNGTFGPSPFPVLDKLKEGMMRMAKTGEYGSSDSFRNQVAGFLQVKKELVSLTHNTTEGINMIAQGLPLQEGDEIILTTQEHVGNALPWLNLAACKKTVLKVFQPSQTQAEVFEQVKSMVTSKTRVIAVHITCTTGQVLPVKEICSFARTKGIWTVIDGAHGPGALPLDLDQLGCDAYSSCFHKWMTGPAGTGFLYLHNSMLEKVQPVFVGAYSDKGWRLEEKNQNFAGFVSSAHKFDFGTQNNALWESAGEAIRFMEQIGLSKIETRIRELSDRLYQGLQAFSGKLQVLTPDEKISRLSMVTFKPKSKDYLQFNDLALKNGFRIRVVPENGLDAIRISTHIYNSPEEIDKFLDFINRTL